MERIRIAVLSITSLTCLMISVPVSAQRDGRPEVGLTLAKRDCAQCHAVERGTTSSPNAAAPRFEVIANTPGMTATAVSAALLTSHRTMPNLILNADERSDIIAYILSLKRPN
jgi:mono/diheme cytochrome c family protein